MKQKAPAENYLEELTTLPELKVSSGEVILGTLAGLDHQGNVLVDFPGNILNTAISAISTLAINQQHSGRQVALLFADNDLSRPIIVGLIRNPLEDILNNIDLSGEDDTDVQTSNLENKNNQKATVSNESNDMFLDGERVMLEAKKEIVLKCGDSSITLTETGKILVKGKYLLNRSSGVYRIVGGSVQIN